MPPKIVFLAGVVLATGLCGLPAAAQPPAARVTADRTVGAPNTGPRNTAPQNAAPRPEPAAEVVRLWPGAAPGTETWSGPETDARIPLPGAPVLHMTSNVTTPTLTVYRPAPGTATGSAVVVVPGGGFQTLAVTHEGEMVARWLAARGVTAFVLKYRVRPDAALDLPGDLGSRPERFREFFDRAQPARRLAVSDAIQALRVLRQDPARFGIAPDRIGMIGFSAGAVTTMGVIQDGKPSDWPNFAAPIYGAMADTAAPPGAPPLFIAATEDDATVPVANSVEIFSRWSAAHLPAELHLYQSGGHGFGMVTHRLPVDGWTVAFEAWLRQHGWLTHAPS